MVPVVNQADAVVPATEENAETPAHPDHGAEMGDRVRLVQTDSKVILARVIIARLHGLGLVTESNRPL